MLAVVYILEVIILFNHLKTLKMHLKVSVLQKTTHVFESSEKVLYKSEQICKQP